VLFRSNPGAATREGVKDIEMLPNDSMSRLFLATAQATEEAIVNALVAAETMVGINGNTVYALPQDRLIDILREHNRIP
jgi:L-aminopeptidase/D-esterase-like protein